MNKLIQVLVAISFVLPFLVTRSTANDIPLLQIQESQRNIFAGQNTFYHVINTSHAPVSSLLWRLIYNNRTLAQGTTRFGNNGQDTALAELNLPAPAIHDGVMIPANLSLFTTPDTAPVLTEKIFIFPADPFANSKQSLSDLKIALYDPDKTTQGTLEKIGLPFQPFSNIEALPSFKGQLFIVGQNVNFDQNPELWNSLRALAKRRVPILILVPQKGRFELTNALDSSVDPAYEKLILARGNIIRAFDKNLDIDWVSGDGSASSGVTITNDDMTMHATVDPNPISWPWLELSRKNSGTMIICGFDIVSTAERSPAPRYFLARLIDHLINTHSEEDLK